MAPPLPSLSPPLWVDSASEILPQKLSLRLPPNPALPPLSPIPSLWMGRIRGWGLGQVHLRRSSNFLKPLPLQAQRLNFFDKAWIRPVRLQLDLEPMTRSISIWEACRRPPFKHPSAGQPY